MTAKMKTSLYGTYGIHLLDNIEYIQPSTVCAVK